METLPDFFLLYFIVIFIAFWIVVSFLNSLLEGWWFLSQNYRAHGKFIGKKYFLKTLWRRRFMMYHHFFVTIVVNSEGLYFSIFPLERLAHPPLFFPWYDIEVEEAEPVFFSKVYKLRFKKNPKTPIYISRRLGNKIFKDYWNKIQSTSTFITS